MLTAVGSPPAKAMTANKAATSAVAAGRSARLALALGAGKPFVRGLPPGVRARLRRSLDTFLLTPVLALAVASVPALTVPALAQRMPKPVERYNRVTKGANVTEWHRRLSDADPKVRLEAVESLTQAGGDEVVKPLLDAVADPDRRVRLKAIDGLGRVGLPEATPSLVQRLFLSEVEPELKQRVLAALGRIADPRAAGPVADFVMQAADTTLRCAAIHAVGEIAHPGSIERLETLSKDADADVRRLAEDAIVKIKARLASLPDQQPSVLELERRMGRRDR